MKRTVIAFNTDTLLYHSCPEIEFEKYMAHAGWHDVTDQPHHVRAAGIEGEWTGSGPLPRTLREKGTEHGEQTALFCWAAAMANVGIFPELKHMFAIPNGGEREKASAAMMVAEGVRSGVPDVCLPVMRRQGNGWFGGLYIEMKRANGKPSDVSEKQTKWITALQENGYAVVVCYGWLQARDVLLKYLELDA